MAVSPKIIYLEADEEITSAIDKLRKTEFKKVVFVVPKEATLLQSVINIKLLKRQADILEKSIALVTHDKVGRALAEKIGILASSKLEDVVNEAEFVPVPLSEIEEEAGETPAKKGAENSPLAETSEVIFKEKPKPEKVVEELEDLVVKEDPEIAHEEEKWTKKEVEQSEGNLMPKMPKKKLFIAAGAILLILLSLAYIYIPRGKAEILVNAERKPVTIDFRGEKDAKIDTEKAVIPVQSVETEKEISKKFPATGKKNVGEKASGTLRIGNGSGVDINWVAGTRFYPSSNPSLIYTANSPVHAPDGEFTSISVTASSPGEQYNGFGANEAFKLASSTLPSSITITSKDGMSGGSNKEISYVTQGDVNAAKDTLTKEATEEATTEFNKKTEEIKLIDDTKKEEVVSATASPTVNGEGTEFSLTVKVKLRALGYSLNDVGELVKSEVERQLGSTKEVVDSGSSEAVVEVDDVNLDNGTISGTIKTDAYASEKIDVEKVKIEIAGLNATKAENYLKTLDGVKEVKFQFFPSFLKSFSRLKNHIFVTIQVADKENL